MYIYNPNLTQTDLIDIARSEIPKKSQCDGEIKDLNKTKTRWTTAEFDAINEIYNSNIHIKENGSASERVQLILDIIESNEKYKILFPPAHRVYANFSGKYYKSYKEVNIFINSYIYIYVYIFCMLS